MKLYGHPLSPCTRKILLLTCEKGTTLDVQAVDLFAGAQHTPPFRELHPFGRVPVLFDEDFRLYESRPILRYLDARLPGPSFVPRDVRERARMDQWLSVDHSYVAPHTRTLAIENVVRRSQGHVPDAAAIAAARVELERAFDVFDAELARHPYLAGETPSLADLSLLPYLASAAAHGADDLMQARPHLLAYRQRMLARPGYARVLEK